MAKPFDRESFTNFCLRALGEPVIKINVSPEQVDDRVDQALQKYRDYHFDGSIKVYYKHQVTAQDRANKYITLPDNIMGVVRVFPIGGIISQSDGLFNIQYQIALNDLYTLTSVSMVPYYMMRQHLALIEEILVGQTPIRYNRHINKVYLDMDWDKILDGSFVLVEAYEVVDPDEFPAVWNDRWLQEYAIQLIKQQWGNNTKKFQGVQLPGGVTYTGQQIYNEATAKLRELDDDMLNSWSIPCTDFIG